MHRVVLIFPAFVLQGKGLLLALRCLTLIFFGIWGVLLHAAEGDGYLFGKVNVSIYNQGGMQRGAKYFVNYCLSCHSSYYARYKKVGEDLQLSEEQVEKNLIFTGARIGDLMRVAMPVKAAAEWFGHTPPDLTLVARVRGADWIYNYLKSFYVDESRPNGVNNPVLQYTAMPHVLWDLQGWQEPQFGQVVDDDGHKRNVLIGLTLKEKGSLTPEEYDRVVHDIVTFLVYMADPAAIKRQSIGFKVVAFLLVLFVLVYFLKQEFWKTIDRRKP